MLVLMFSHTTVCVCLVLSFFVYLGLGGLCWVGFGLGWGLVREGQGTYVISMDFFSFSVFLVVFCMHEGI